MECEVIRDKTSLTCNFRRQIAKLVVLNVHVPSSNTKPHLVLMWSVWSSWFAQYDLSIHGNDVTHEILNLRYFAPSTTKQRVALKLMTVQESYTIVY